MAVGCWTFTLDKNKANAHSESDGRLGVSRCPIKSIKLYRPVFPLTVLKAISERPPCSFRLIRWKSAMPPLCINYFMRVRSHKVRRKRQSDHQFPMYKWVAIIQ